MAGLSEKLRGYGNEFVGVAKQLLGEVIGSQREFDEGKQQQAKGKAQVEWGQAKAEEETKPYDPLKETR